MPLVLARMILSLIRRLRPGKKYLRLLLMAEYRLPPDLGSHFVCQLLPVFCLTAIALIDQVRDTHGNGFAIEPMRSKRIGRRLQGLVFFNELTQISANFGRDFLGVASGNGI